GRRALPAASGRTGSLPHAVAARVPQRLGRHQPLHPLAEELDRHRGPRTRELRRQVRVRDGEPYGVPEAAARAAAPHAVLDAYRLAPERDPRGIGERQARELPARALGALARERLAADELALPELDREAEARLVRCVVGGNVGAPVPVSLLQAQG